MQMHKSFVSNLCEITETLTLNLKLLWPTSKETHLISVITYEYGGKGLRTLALLYSQFNERSHAREEMRMSMRIYYQERI